MVLMVANLQTHSSERRGCSRHSAAATAWGGARTAAKTAAFLRLRSTSMPATSVTVLLAFCVAIAWQPNLSTDARLVAMNDARTRIRPLKSENSEEGKVIERFCKKRQATASEIPQGMVMDQLPYHGQCNHRGKVFGVGVFKTGTSSLSRELSDLGYTPCAQARGFFLFGGAKLKYYFFDGPVMRQAIQADPEMRRDLRAVVNMTLSAADGPWLFYHKEFDEWFPGSKFVLTTRKDPQQLVDSEMAMRIGPSHPLFPGLEGNLTLATAIHSYLTIIDPKQSDKVKRTLQQLLVWGLLTRRRYDQHTAAVRRHFVGRPEDLLEICIDCDDGEDPDAALRTFLGCPHPPGATFPHFNSARQKGWSSHAFLSQEDMDAGVTDWRRWPEPKFEPWTLPIYPDLVAAQVKRYSDQVP